MKIQISNDLPLARKFNRTFRYIDDLLTLNNPGFCTFIDQIYPKELKLKRLLTFMINVKPKIVNFPRMDSNIPSTPAYGVFVSELIRYMRVCGNYQQFVYRLTLITTRLRRQGFNYLMLCRTFKNLTRNPMVLRKYQWSHKQMTVECVSLPLCVFRSKSIYIVCFRASTVMCVLCQL